MKELNERAALNYKLRQDALNTEHQARMARQRMKYRRINQAYRRSITNMAIDAALIGASLVGCVVAVAYLICVAVV